MGHPPSAFGVNGWVGSFERFWFGKKLQGSFAGLRMANKTFMLEETSAFFI
jgi:hypothetical protein